MKTAAPGGTPSSPPAAGGEKKRGHTQPVIQYRSVYDPLNPEERSRRMDLWTRELSLLAAVERAPFFVDVDLAAPPIPFRSTQPFGVTAMKVLALGAQRRWQQMSGVQVFTRTAGYGPSSPGVFEHEMLDWMHSLAPSDRTALMQGKLHLDQVDPAYRESIVGWAIRLQPAIAPLLLRRGFKAALGVNLNPIIEWRNARTGVHEWTPIATPLPPLDVPSDSPAPNEGLVTGPTGGDKLDLSTPGPLDFGGGRVLELKTIVDMAAKVFLTRYDMDARLAHATFFVSGAYGRAAFEDVLKAATTIEPVTRSNAPHGWLGEQAIRDSILDGYPDLIHDPLVYKESREQGEPLAVSSSAFLQGEDMTVAQLAAGSQNLLNHLTNGGMLSPDSMVHLRPALVFRLDAGGIEVGESAN